MPPRFGPLPLVAAETCMQMARMSRRQTLIMLGKSPGIVRHALQVANHAVMGIALCEVVFRHGEFRLLPAEVALFADTASFFIGGPSSFQIP